VTVGDKWRCSDGGIWRCRSGKGVCQASRPLVFSRSASSMLAPPIGDAGAWMYTAERGPRMHTTAVSIIGDQDQ